MRLQCAILFSAHPSKSGVATGHLDSGSTAWEGKVRARLTLRDPEADDDDDQQCGVKVLSDRRILTRAKANYARQGEELPLVFENGGFKAIGLNIGGARHGAMRDLAADAKFIDLLQEVRRSGAYVHDAPTSPHRYAPRVFAKHPNRGDFSPAEFARAMARLLAAGKIRLIKVGRKDHEHSEIEPV